MARVLPQTANPRNCEPLPGHWLSRLRGPNRHRADRCGLHTTRPRHRDGAQLRVSPLRHLHPPLKHGHHHRRHVRVRAGVQYMRCQRGRRMRRWGGDRHDGCRPQRHVQRRARTHDRAAALLPRVRPSPPDMPRIEGSAPLHGPTPPPTPPTTTHTHTHTHTHTRTQTDTHTHTHTHTPCPPLPGTKGPTASPSSTAGSSRRWRRRRPTSSRRSLRSPPPWATRRLSKSRSPPGR